MKQVMGYRSKLTNGLALAREERGMLRTRNYKRGSGIAHINVK